MRKGSPRRLYAGLSGLIGVVFVVVAVVVIGGDTGSNDALASIVSAFVGLAALAVSLVGLAPPAGPSSSAEELAADLARTIREEWLDETGSRKPRDPNTLPLTWSSGRMDGPLEEATRQLAGEYRNIRTGRLVVLGEPGSGKTVLAMLLTLGLIAGRTPTSPVPVLLSASSWDPVRDPLDDWIVHTLAGEYYNGDAEIPRKLLTHGLVLPVLDGLDEIPEVARRHAVHRINSAVGAERPVVVTCRAAEYEDLIKAGSPTLRRAPVQRVEPIAVPEIVDHLDAVPDWPASTSWTAVHEELRRAPDGSVAAALSTPLMISLAVTAYRGGGDPSELLDTNRFPSRHAVEDHLVDRAIDAAYAPGPGSASRWAGKGRDWLAYLARYLHDHRERDLAWWRLADRLVSPWITPMLGIGIGLSMVLLVGGLAAVTGFESAESVVGLAGVVGVVVASLSTAVWYGSTGRTPGRMGVVWQGSGCRLRHGFRTGAAFVLIPGTPVPVVTALAGILALNIEFAVIVDFVRTVVMGVAAFCVVGFAVAAHRWLDAIPERSARATPLDFLRPDRRAAIVGAVVAGTVTAVSTWPMLAAANLVGEVLGQGIAGWSGTTGTAHFPTLEASLQLDGTAQVAGTLVVLPFLGVALLVLLTRAWPRFVLARTVLAITGRLPWRLLGFLTDARDRGLLRRSGGTYQFRHVRLQQRLALPADGPSSTSAVPVAATRRRRIVAVTVVVTVLATAVVTLTTFNHLRCSPAFSTSTEVDRQQADPVADLRDSARTAGEHAAGPAGLGAAGQQRR
ncbi:NACHT domain-containing protein [Actinophytocola sp.]|uniref:NACHT domain-containing protein n=1 Tax=Actinophytocola sp. TaxID=1872138 RepID=UPI003D6B5CBB